MLFFTSMWPHFVNLLNQSGHNFLTALGTTGLGWWVQGIIWFFAMEFAAYGAVWLFRGKAAMWGRFAENFWIGVVAWLAVMLCVYGSIFMWHVAKTAYDDHEWLVAKIGSAGHEVETLKSNLKDTQQKLVDAEKRKPLPKDRCVWKSYAMRPPRDINGAMSTNETWIVCSYAVNPPYSINIEYNELPFSFVMPPQFPPGVDVGEPLIVTNGKEWKMSVNSSRPLPAWSVLMFSVYGKNSQPPVVVSLTINSANRNTIPTGGVVSH